MHNNTPVTYRTRFACLPPPITYDFDETRHLRRKSRQPISFPLSCSGPINRSPGCPSSSSSLPRSLTSYPPFLSPQSKLFSYRPQASPPRLRRLPWSSAALGTTNGFASTRSTPCSLPHRRNITITVSPNCAAAALATGRLCVLSHRQGGHRDPRLLSLLVSSPPTAAPSFPGNHQTHAPSPPPATCAPPQQPCPRGRPVSSSQHTHGYFPFSLGK